MLIMNVIMDLVIGLTKWRMRRSGIDYLRETLFFFLCPTLATIGITVFFILPAFRKTLSYQKGVRLENQTETSMTLDGDHEKNYA